MDDSITFGQVVRERRGGLGLTQTELARRVGCAAITIRKIEANALRPSVQMAERIAISLNVPEGEQLSFVRLARSEEAPSPLPSPSPLPDEIGLTDLSGRAVRGFQLGEKIGSGGFGVVYRAVQSSVNRDVAVKIILPRYANHPSFIRRFEAEAQLIARLEHPHIVPLYDYWREPDAAYLIMQLLRGGSLEDQIKNGPIAVDMIYQYTRQISLALDVAHRSGVVHRDIKPANVLLDNEANAYLADFGIAKNLDGLRPESLAEGAVTIESPVYISPEQILAEPVKPQSDIYLLGLLLFEMLTGEKPFHGPTPVAYIEQHLQQKTPSIHHYNTSLPPGLDKVIQVATAKKMSDRYPDVPSFIRAFQQAASTIEELTVSPIYNERLPESSFQDFAEVDNPYMGLRPFGEADADHFYGRDTLIQEMFSTLSEPTELVRFLAVVGPSGSGKSSVVKAGLVPALRRGGLPGSDSWFVVDLSPGTHPWEEVEAALLRVAVNPPATLLNQLKDGDRGLLRAVRRVLPDDGQTELVLIIDQFEELFTLVEDESLREQFLNSLVTAVLEERSRLRVIITLRADFFDRPLQYVDFGELLRERTISILPMTSEELEQAINLPASQAGIRLETGLAGTIIRDVGDQPGTLPSLQFVLTELFERRDSSVMTRAAYESVGGVSGALAKRADEIYQNLDQNGRAGTRQLFLRLITLGEGVEDTRRRVPIAELRDLVSFNGNEPAGNNGLMDDLLNTFSRYRLLTFDRDPVTRDQTVEVAHEALLREWARLRHWLDESRADVRSQRNLTRAVKEWQESGRDDGFLIPGGAKLEQYIIWRDEARVALTQAEEDYLQASITADLKQKEHLAQQVRMRRNLRRGLIVVLVVGLVVALALSIYAFNQQRLAEERRQEALRQASIGLAALADEEMDGGNQDLAALLALEALEEYPFTSQAAGALARVVDEYRAFRVLDLSNSITSLVMVASWSPDGKRVAAGASPSPNSVVIWDAQSGRELISVNAHQGLCQETYTLMRDMAWSPDGTQLATTVQETESGQACGVVVIDTLTGDRLVTLNEIESPAWSLDWSSDGTSLVSGHEDGIARIWDSTSWELKTSLEGHQGIIRDTAFSPDGQSIASASEDGTVRMWDVNSAAERLILSGHVGAVRSLAWSPDGGRLVTGGNDGLPRIWDAVSGETILVLPGHTKDVVIVTWSADGRRVASQGLDALVKVWDAATGGLLYQIPNTAPEPSTKRGFVEFSPGGEWILAGGSRVLGPRIWDTSMLVPKMFGHTFGLEWAGWSPDGKLIATSGEDGSARLWDAKTGDQVGEFPLGSFWSDWSPDGKKLVFAEGSGAYRLNIWDVGSSELTAILTVPQDEFGAPQFLTIDWSPDGAYIAAAGFRPGRPQPIYIWDAKTYELVSTLHSDDVCMFGWPRWSPDSTMIAGGCIFVQAGMNTPARIWDAVTGEELMKLESEDGWTYRTVWSPDGSKILVTYEHGVARIFDTSSGEVLLSFTAHQGQTGGEWSPDGTLIASSDYATRMVKIWRSESGEELFSFSLPGAPLTVGWSPDGQYIIVTGDGFNEPIIKRVWRSPEELITHARECCTSRQLTQKERIRFGLPASQEDLGH